jgi:tRNA(Ile)-lysidine synthase
LYDLDFNTVARAITFLSDPPYSRTADLGLGMRLILENGEFYIATLNAELPPVPDPQLTEMGSLRLPIPGQLHLAHGWLIVGKFVRDGEHAKEKALINSDPFQTWISLESRKQILTLRPRQSGDRFAPLGMHGQTAKISDFMINQKIPRRARAAWPLVCINSEIAWVPGFRLGENFKLSAATKNVVHLRLTREEVNSLEVDA